MALSFKKLTGTRTVWQTPAPGGDDILICTMGRLVRNLPGYPFPGWSSAKDRGQVAETLLPVLESLSDFRGAFYAEMPKLTRPQRLMLLERKQLTPSMAARQDGCHVLISARTNMVAMVNEEEHLCVHTSVPGLDTGKVLDQLGKLGFMLDGMVGFAALPEEGYLTSLPAEAGEGLQLYAVLHLPALLRTDMIGRVRKGLEKLDLNMAAFYADAEEEDDASGLFVVFTTAIAKGETVGETDRFTRICNLLAWREAAVRRKLAADDGTADAVCRAYALLRHSRCMDFKEMVNLLSLVRLGFALGLLGPSDEAGDTTPAGLAAEVLELYTAAAPARLRALNPDATDKAAAMRIRSQAAAATMARIQINPFQDSTH